jgi:hypothetical protein
MALQLRAGRMAAFSDRVIAVIITIMVLELRVPAQSLPDVESLRKVLPMLVIYADGYNFQRQRRRSCRYLSERGPQCYGGGTARGRWCAPGPVVTCTRGILSVHSGHVKGKGIWFGIGHWHWPSKLGTHTGFATVESVKCRFLPGCGPKKAGVVE